MQSVPDKPAIDYPCTWEWRVIGGDSDQLRRAVAEVLGQRPYALREANRSPAGRWLSMSLELDVASEGDRNQIHQALAGHRFVRLLL